MKVFFLMSLYIGFSGGGREERDPGLPPSVYVRVV